MSDVPEYSTGDRILLGVTGFGFKAISIGAAFLTCGASLLVTGTKLTRYDESTNAMIDCAFTGKFKRDD